MIDDRASPIERGKRLKILRGMTGLSKKAFGKKYNVSSTSLHYWEHGVASGISEKGAHKIVRTMRESGIQCTAAWLMSGLGVYPQFFDACLNQDVLISDENAFSTAKDEKIIQYEIERFRQLNAGTLILAIMEDSMEPLYRTGDYIGGKKMCGESIEKIIDQDCIVATEDKQIICRRIAATAIKGSYNLYSVNPKTKVYPPILYGVKIISAAPIIRVWRRNPV